MDHQYDASTVEEDASIDNFYALRDQSKDEQLNIDQNNIETNKVIVNSQNDNNNIISDVDAGSNNSNSDRQVFNRLYEHAMNLRMKQ